MAVTQKILFCVVVKGRVVRSSGGKKVVGPRSLVARFLHFYRGGKLTRYHGQEAHPAR